MPNDGHLSGEDKVIVACVALLTLLTVVALVALTVVPANTNTIIPVMAGTVIAISSLAARHPPISSSGTVVTLPATQAALIDPPASTPDPG